MVPHGDRMIEGTLYECGRPGCNCWLRKDARGGCDDEWSIFLEELGKECIHVMDTAVQKCLPVKKNRMDYTSWTFEVWRRESSYIYII